MRDPLSPARLLREIGNIRQMVIGSITKRKDGHFNLNTYQYCPKAGKKRTHTRYLAASDRPVVDKLIAAGDRFCDLMETYAELILTKTRREYPVLSRKKKRKRAVAPVEESARPKTRLI